MVSHRKTMLAGVLSLGLALCILLVASSAVAGDDDIAALRSQLEQLEPGVSADAGQDEFDLAKQWLSEAEELRAQGARRGVEQRVRRVDHTIALLRVIIETNDMRTGIDRQKDALEQSRLRIEELREDIESLEAQKADRQRELERIQSGD
jgi:hypothetical protein